MKVTAHIITADDNEITVERFPGAVVVTVNQGHSEPGKMPTFEFELTDSEAVAFSAALWTPA